MSILFLVIFLLFFVFVLFLVLLSVYDKKNIVFPAILVFLKVKLVKSSLLYMFYAFVLAFVFVLSVCSLNNEVALFCVCVVCFLFFVNKTRWFLDCIVWSCFFWLFVFIFVLFFIPFKKTKNPDTAKTPKTKMQKKGQKEISVSAIVFTNSVPNFLGVGYKNVMFAESPIK